MIRSAVSFNDSARLRSSCSGESFRYLCESDKMLVSHHSKIQVTCPSLFIAQQSTEHAPSIIPMPIWMIILHCRWPHIVASSHLHHELLVDTEFSEGGIFVVTLQGSIVPFIQTPRFGHRYPMLLCCIQSHIARKGCPP